MKPGMRHPKHKAILIVLALSSSLFLLFFHLFMMPKQLFTSPTSTVILDDRGGLLSARIASDGQWRFPEADSLDERLVSCIVQYEDRRFYRHFGIDPIAICRAVKRNLTSHSVKEGASTITMQLARLARGNQPRTLKKKTWSELMLPLGVTSTVTSRVCRGRNCVVWLFCQILPL